MIIILCLYIVALWLVFSKFKLMRWGWLSGTVSVLIGVSDRSSAIPIQSCPVAGVAGRGATTDPTIEIEL